MYHGSELIEKYVSLKTSKQTSALGLVKDISNNVNFDIVLDLGCGTGDSIDFFKKLNKNINWIGVDVDFSQEVKRRIRSGAEFLTFDGINIPVENESFDLIFCRQVFEHVEKPFELMIEINRVLKKGGYLIGSTSYLELFHSLSTFNYTPYGFSLLVNSSNLCLTELRPGIDVFTLFLSRFFNWSSLISKLFSYYFENQSPINYLLDWIGVITGKSKKDINLLKLLFCGHFCFVAKKIST